MLVFVKKEVELLLFPGALVTPLSLARSVANRSSKSVEELRIGLAQYRQVSDFVLAVEYILNTPSEELK